MAISLGITKRRGLHGRRGGTASGVLAACGTATSSTGQPGGTSALAGDIVYMTPWSGAQLEIMNQVNDLFAQKYPKIKVNVVPQPSNGYDGVVASFAAG